MAFIYFKVADFVVSYYTFGMQAWEHMAPSSLGLYDTDIVNGVQNLSF